MDNNQSILTIILRAKDEASEKLKAFSQQAKKAGEDIGEVGESLVKLGAAPTVALLAVTKAAMDFEDSFAGIRKTVDLSEKEFDQLSQNLRTIAKEAPVPVNELNRIAELAGQLGVAGVEDITKFTNTITKFTTATGMAAETAAMSFARIANVMQEPIKNIDRMGSVVAMLGDAGAATEAEILGFSERIAGAGKIAGLATAEVFAIGSAMASVGVEAEAGGTAVQKVLLSMYQAASGSTASVIDNSEAIAKNTEKLAKLKGQLEGTTKKKAEFTEKTKESTKFMAQQRLDKYSADIAAVEQELGSLNATHGQTAISASSFAKVLGVTNQEFEKMFKQDPGKVFQQFVNKLGEISKEGGNAAGVLEELDMADQRLMRAFLSLSNAGELVNEQFKIANKEFEVNNRLNEEAAKRYATASSQLQILKNNFYDMGITVGAAVLPHLTRLVETVKPLIERMAQWTAQHPNLVAGLLAAGAAVGMLGVALVAIGSVITNGAVALSALTTVLGGTVTVVTTAAALLGGPLTIALSASALAAMFLATQTDFLKTKQDLLRDAQDKLKQSTDDLAGHQQTLHDYYAQLETLALRAERAQKNYNDMVKRFGPESLEAREAMDNIKQIRGEYAKIEKNVNDELAKSPKIVEAHKKSLEEHNRISKSTETIWGNILHHISGAISKLSEWNEKAMKSSGGTIGFGNPFKMQFADGGWVPQTGPALVHAGEYVLSRDMLAGKQPIQAPITNNTSNRSITMHNHFHTDVSAETLVQQLSFQLKFNSAL